jgi:hypothetical protein
MSVEDELHQYVRPATDSGSQPKDDPAVAARVEELLSELNLSWSVDEDGDWTVESDEGDVVLVLGGETLTFTQHLHRLSEKPKKLGDYYQALLLQNVRPENSAAFFLIWVDEGEREALMVGIRSEISVRNLDKSELALSLKSVLELSRFWSVYLAKMVP